MFESASSSEITFSDIDDKNDPNYFPEEKQFQKLPPAVREVVRNSQTRAKHSDFYYRLKNLNFKIGLYNKLFTTKVPSHHIAYMMNKLKKLEAR